MQSSMRKLSLHETEPQALVLLTLRTLLSAIWPLVGSLR